MDLSCIFGGRFHKIFQVQVVLQTGLFPLRKEKSRNFALCSSNRTAKYVYTKIKSALHLKVYIGKTTF